MNAIGKSIALLLIMMMAGTLSANPDSKKLQVFILAGQSNMVGHANSHTMATLYDSDVAGDQ